MDATQNGHGTQQPRRVDDGDTVVVDVDHALDALDELTPRGAQLAELRALVRNYFDAVHARRAAAYASDEAYERAFVRSTDAELALVRAVSR